MITIDEIQAERARQNEKHPVSPKKLVDHIGELKQLESSKRWYQYANDVREKNGEHDYYGLVTEEVLEVFTAKTREERHIEIVQAIALLVRLDEDEAI